MSEHHMCLPCRPRTSQPGARQDLCHTVLLLSLLVSYFFIFLFILFIFLFILFFIFTFYFIFTTCSIVGDMKQQTRNTKNVQEDAVVVHEPVDLLLTCVRQVLLLAKPRDRFAADSIIGMADGDTTPSILRGPPGSQDANPDQVRQSLFSGQILWNVE